MIKLKNLKTFLPKKYPPKYPPNPSQTLRAYTLRFSQYQPNPSIDILLPNPDHIPEYQSLEY